MSEWGLETGYVDKYEREYPKSDVHEDDLSSYGGSCSEAQYRRGLWLLYGNKSMSRTKTNICLSAPNPEYEPNSVNEARV